MQRILNHAYPLRTWAKGVISLAAAAAFLLGPTGRSAAADLRTASLTPGTVMPRNLDLPSVLSADDAEHYRNIFALQDSGHWAAADREIAQLHDKLLLGEVLAQRYRHRGYHTSYEELASWLDR